MIVPLAIRGTGTALPGRVVPNAEFEKILDTSDAWIQGRTGIRERRFAADGESCLTLAAGASRRALADAGMSAGELDLIIVGTVTPEYALPSTACLLQSELGAGHIPAFDINVACSGFVYGMIIASRMIQGGPYRNILVVGAEHLSSIINLEDRASCILFGDGAGAAIVSSRAEAGQGLLHSSMGADGGAGKLIWVPGGGSREPFGKKVLNERLHFIRMRGREVYKWAVVKMQDIIHEAVRAAGVTTDDIAAFLIHQSNLRIIEAVRERMGLPGEKIVVNIDRVGNTSSASVGIVLDEARRAGRARAGDLVLLVALGAGLTWATALLRL